MKKVLLLFGFVIISLISFSQKTDTAANFPRKHAELLLGKELKVLPKDVKWQEFGYSGFYKHKNFDKEIMPKLYSSDDNISSKYSSLVGKVFKVLSIEPYKNIIGTDKFKLEIENSETGIIYFDYDSKYEFDFPFKVVGGLNLPEGFYCEDVTTTVDKFTGDTTYTSKVSEGTAFIKVKNGNKSVIYISKNQPGNTLNVKEKGFILLLQNGFRIDKPDAPIDVESNGSGGWVYSVFVALNENDIKLLTENAITDDRLYIYDGTIKYGKTLMEYLKCIVAK
jgi:hypothetical protein